MLFRLNGRKAVAFAAVPLLAVPNPCNAEARMSGEVSPNSRAGRPVKVASVSSPAITMGEPKRHRPSWIWNLFGFGSDMAECTSWRRAGDVAPPMTVRRYEAIGLCFKGFISGDAPRLQIFGPDGKRAEGPTKADIAAGGRWEWLWHGDDAGEIFRQPGVYRYTVTAAHTVGTSGSILVKPATRSGVYFSFDEPIRPGEVVTATAVGRKPGSLVLASLYGDERDARPEPKLMLLQDLKPVEADSNGEAVIRWVATEDVTSGTHVLLVEPIASGEHECDLSCTVFEVKNRN